MKQDKEEENVVIDIPECSIAFEETDMAPNETIIKKRAIEIKGTDLKEVRKHFNEIWGKK